MKDALSGDKLQTLIGNVITAYCGSDSSDIALLVSDDQKKELSDYAAARFASAVAGGLTIESDNSVAAGFKLRMSGDHLEHEFTDEAVTDALCRILRPHLADILRGQAAANEGSE